MKHWSEFLENKTHETKRLGKMSNAFLFDVKQKEIELKAATESHQETEREIVKKISKHYNSETELKQAIELAISKATNWNNSPINNHKPHTQK